MPIETNKDSMIADCLKAIHIMHLGDRLGELAFITFTSQFWQFFDTEPLHWYKGKLNLNKPFADMQIRLICLTKASPCRHILHFDINLSSTAGEWEVSNNNQKMGKVRRSL